MALATQCPHCRTTFRVANDQLKLRAGMVRCGQCRQVFNGIAYLLPPAGQQKIEPAASQPTSTAMQVADDAKTGGQSGAGANSTPLVAAIPAAMPAAMPAAIPVTAQPADTAPVAPLKYDPEVDDLEELDYEALGRMTLLHFAQAEPPVEQYYPTPAVTPDAAPPEQLAPEARLLTAANTAPAPTPPDRIAYPLPAQASPVAAPAVVNAVQEEPGFVTATRRQQHRKHRTRMLFGVGSAILALVLLAQASYALRNQIAAHLPQAKPTLLAICQALGCSISLPAQIDATTIESSELQAQTSPADTLILTLLLRNRSSTAQAWPNIELTLNDGNQRAILRRVFTPREFPVTAAGIAEGIAANSEQSVRLTFTLPQLQAAGYRVVLFYP